MTIGIGRNELPIFVIVLPIPIQYCNINNPAVLCLFCPWFYGYILYYRAI